jgi:hypothetical protein
MPPLKDAPTPPSWCGPSTAPPYHGAHPMLTPRPRYLERPVGVRLRKCQIFLLSTDAIPKADKKFRWRSALLALPDILLL